MTNYKAIRKRLTALGMAALLSVSLGTASVSAEPAEEVNVMAVSEETESETPPEEIITPEPENPSQEIAPPADSEGNEDTSEIETEDPSSEEIENSEEEAEEEDDAESEEESDEMKGRAIVPDTDFAISVTGVELKLWKSEKNGKYYLFVPNNISIPDLTFKVSGITFDSISTGSYDAETEIISGAFSGNNSSVTIKSKTGNSYDVIVMQAPDTASVMITLNGTTLSEIHRNSKEIKYPGNTVQVIDTAGGVLERGNVEIKGRGNTTWVSSNKKPYQIKFESKESVLGMTKAKKWVLLANAFDETMMRNEVAFATSRALEMPFTPSYKYANLWVDGEYRGTYMIGEKIEIGTGRVQLSHPQGILCELDGAYYNEEEYWFRTSVNTFAVKDYVSENPADIQAGMNSFKAKLDGLMSYLNRTPSNSVTMNALSQYIDVDSIVKYYFMFDYLRLPDGAASSCYFYMDGPDDVIHYGPVWDYDNAMGNHIYSTFSSPTGYDATRSALLAKLLPTVFSRRASELYGWFTSGKVNPLAYAQNLYPVIQSSQRMNYARWEYALGQSGTNKYPLKGDMAPFKSTYDAGYSKLTSFLSQRSQYYIPGNGYATATQSGDSVVVTFNGKTTYSKISVAAWSNTNGQDDLGWYDAAYKGNNVYQAKIPLSKFKHAGDISLHVYIGGTATCLTITSFNIKPLSDKPEAITCNASGNAGSEQTKFTVTAKNYTSYSSTISAAVWSLDKGQDDLKWYSMSPDGAGNYKGIINIANHKTLGEYLVDLYDSNRFLGRVSINVDPIVPGEITLVDNHDDTITATVKVSSKSGIQSVTFPTWTEKNGQDDLVWHSATKNADGTYSCTIKASSHKNEGGNYIVHCYATDGNGIQQFVNRSAITIEAPKTPQFSITCTAVNGGETITVKNIPQEANSIQVAIWGDKDGQNDLLWLTNSYSPATGSASVTFYPKANAETGVYNVHVYAINNAGRQFFVDRTTFTRTNTATGTITVSNVANGNATVTISNINTTFKLAKIVVPTWTPVNGQDDLVWHAATKNNETTFTTTISKSKHKNELGRYVVHVYAEDANAYKVFLGSAEFDMK